MKNMMIKYSILVVITFSLGISATTLAAEPGSGTIEGAVFNKTTDGSSVADQDITLKAYLNDAEVSAAITRTDSDGYFVFGNLSAEPGYTYQATLTFQGVEYNSEWLSFEDGEATKFAEVVVYDSTTDAEAIKAAMAHTIIYVGQGSLQMKDYFLFVNETDRAYVGIKKNPADEKGETLKFSLPREATELQLIRGLMECCVVSTDDGLSYTMPILPGPNEVAYSYNVEYDSGKYTVLQNINYPLARYDLLFQGEGIKAESDQLQAEEPMNISGTLFNHLSGEDFNSGDVIVAKLSGLPGNSNQSFIIWVTMGLVVLAAGFTFVYLMRKRRLQPVSDEGGLSVTKQQLLAEIAKLDDDFEDGRISEETYRRLRAEKKAGLIELVQRQKEE